MTRIWAARTRSQALKTHDFFYFRSYCEIITVVKKQCVALPSVVGFHVPTFVRGGKNEKVKQTVKLYLNLYKSTEDWAFSDLLFNIKRFQSCKILAKIFFLHEILDVWI